MERVYAIYVHLPINQSNFIKFPFPSHSLLLFVSSLSLYFLLFFAVTCTGAKRVSGPNYLIPYMYKERVSISGLDKTLPTRFKCLKMKKVCVICIICRFHRIEQCFNYMRAKFQVEGLQNRRDMRHCSLDFHLAIGCYFNAERKTVCNVTYIYLRITYMYSFPLYKSPLFRTENVDVLYIHNKVVISFIRVNEIKNKY